MTTRSVLAGLLRAYKRLLSPVLPPACRFHPTCSEYAAEAIEIHGAIRGTALAAGRLLRCHPWNDGGFDPVPPHTAAVRPPRA
jgi:putative membrane protein insertion efficiency factor